MLGTACVKRLNKKKFIKLNPISNFNGVSVYRSYMDVCAQFIRDDFLYADSYYFFIPVDELDKFNKLFSSKGYSVTINNKNDLFKDWLSILDALKMPFTVLDNTDEFNDILKNNSLSLDNFKFQGSNDHVILKMNTEDFINGYHAQIAWNILRYIYSGDDIRYAPIVELFYELLHKDIGLDLYQKLSLSASIGPIVKQKNDIEQEIESNTYDYYQHCPTLPFNLFTLNELISYLKAPSNPKSPYPFFELTCKYKRFFNFEPLPETHHYIKRGFIATSEGTKFKYHTYKLFHNNQINKIIECFNNNKGFEETNKLSYDI